MRARNVKPGFFKNEQLAELPPEGRLLFIGLWCMADREGRLEDRPKRIKMEVFPADSIDTEELLSGLEAQGLILRYQISGASLIQIPRFLDHQSPHYSEKPSVLPPPDSEKSAPSRGSDSGDLRNRHPLNPDSPNPDCSPPESSARGRANGGKSPGPNWAEIANLDLAWWQLWLAHRRAERRKPYKTDRTARMLAGYPPEVQRAAIEQSMDQNWQGLFPERIDAASRRSSATRNRFDEHTERLRDWLDEQLASAVQS